MPEWIGWAIVVGLGAVFAIIITIEAASISCWKKYLGSKGASIGIDSFGESAPYKEVYEHFNLTSSKIVNLIQKMLRE